MADENRWREDDRYRRRDDDRYRSEDEYRGREPGYGSSRGYGEESWRDYGGRGYGGSSRGYEGSRGYGEGGWRGYGRGEDERGRYGSEGRFGESGGGYGWAGYGSRSGSGYGREGYRGEQRGMWDKASDEVSSWFGDEDAERRRRMDAAREGRHRGRGPKGYTRSDERIREDVSDRLSDDPMIDASEIEVNVSNREVTLTGTVDSREARRRAEDCAESVSGVSYVQNNLRVQQSTTDVAETTVSGSSSTGAGLYTR